MDRRKRFLNGELGGIYCLTNKINGKRYIGQTINWPVRKQSYINPKGNRFIEKAIRKYGFNNFKLTILNYSRIGSVVKDRKGIPIRTNLGREITLLDRLEVFYIQKYKSQYPKGYNILAGGQWSGSPIVSLLYNEARRGKKESILSLCKYYEDRYLLKIEPFKKYLDEEILSDFQQEIKCSVIDCVKNGVEVRHNGLGEAIREKIHQYLRLMDYPINIIFEGLWKSKDEKEIIKSLGNEIIPPTQSPNIEDILIKKEIEDILYNEIFELDDLRRFIIINKYGLCGKPSLSLESLQNEVKKRFNVDLSQQELKNRVVYSCRLIRRHLADDYYGK